MSFKFIDLFAGVGGFHNALSQLGGKCVFSSEIDINARKTYELNYKNHNPDLFKNNNFNTDITIQDEKSIPNHDILCAGFPCQAFSIAGYQKGFEDNRGTLFFDIIRILKEKKTPIIFLENVKNLASHAEGETLRLMLKMLKEEGYFIHFKVMNSMEYGNVPQNRERIYIVGFRDKEKFDRFSFPEKIDLKTNFREILEENVDDKYYYNGKSLYDRIKDDVNRFDRAYQWRRQYVRENKSGVFPTLTANMGTGGHNVPIILDKKGIRKITPREAFLIQGFPKNFILPNLADSHLYKQAGNSVSVPVIKRVAEKLLLTFN
ncbi:DNA (cytosine-5-)-methyltransferase [Candidatus Gracilibacteria bacterium]|nr:DNA (cytosine-5-)-methyltransferase [Candidatus Gracilibacteria bacterium]